MKFMVIRFGSPRKLIHISYCINGKAGQVKKKKKKNNGEANRI